MIMSMQTDRRTEGATRFEASARAAGFSYRPVTLPGSKRPPPFFRSEPAAALPGTYASGEASTAPADIAVDKKVLRFIDSCSSAQNFFQVLKSGADSFGRVAG